MRPTISAATITHPITIAFSFDAATEIAHKPVQVTAVE
jgi:hypothetical protein